MAFLPCKDRQRSLKRPASPGSGPDQVFRNVVIVTPLNRISIQALKIVRIENSVKKVIFALYIKDIEEEDYTELKKTMIYFEKFSKNGH